jgi:hypothetical protein
LEFRENKNIEEIHKYKTMATPVSNEEIGLGKSKKPQGL